MRIAIWGAGSVGLGLATTLVGPDVRLLLVGRDPDTTDAIAREGIRRSGLFGDAHAPPDRLDVTRSPAALVDFGPDWLLVCTKAFATAAVADALAPLAEDLPDTTRLVLCQNGWGNETPFLPFWSPRRIYHARIITGFHRRSLVDVEITAHAEPIALGSLFEAPLEDLRPLVGRIAKGGVPAEVVSDMPAVLWAKMLYNCALNPLGALAGRRYGELTAEPATRALVETVVHEIFDVLAKTDVALPWSGADAYLAHFHETLLPPTARHESSMLQDLRARRPTEIEALCGAVERLGATHGVATPVVSSLATLVREAEAQVTPPDRADPA